VDFLCSCSFSPWRRASPQDALCLFAFRFSLSQMAAPLLRTQDSFSYKTAPFSRPHTWLLACLFFGAFFRLLLPPHRDHLLGQKTASVRPSMLIASPFRDRSSRTTQGVPSCSVGILELLPQLLNSPLCVTDLPPRQGFFSSHFPLDILALKPSSPFFKLLSGGHMETVHFTSRSFLTSYTKLRG